MKTETKVFGASLLVMLVGAIFAFLGWQEGEAEQLYAGAAIVIGGLATGVGATVYLFKESGFGWSQFLVEAQEAYLWAREHMDDTVEVLERLRPIIVASGKYHKIDDEDIDRTIDVLKNLERGADD